MIKPESVVIVKWRQGYVAHLRFKDSRHDCDISHNYKQYLYHNIERKVREINEEL